MLSISDALTSELAKPSPDVVIRVDIGECITTTPPANHIVSYHTMPRDGSTNLPSSKPYILDAPSTGYEFDPLSGELKVSGISISVGAVDEVTELVENNRLEGKEVSLHLGIPGTAYQDWSDANTDWPMLWRGVCTEVRHRGGKFQITARSIDHRPDIPSDACIGRRLNESVPVNSYDITTPQGTASMPGYFLSASNPLETLSVLLDEVVGVPARLIDADSLDHTTATNDALGHLRCARFTTPSRDNRLLDSVSVWEIVRDLCYLSGGNALIREDGRVAFHLYDASASAVYEFQDGIDILKGSMDSIGRLEDVVGTVGIATHWAQTDDGSGQSSKEYILKITTVADGTLGPWGWNVDESEDANLILEINDQWFGVFGVNNAAWDYSSDTSVVLDADAYGYTVMGQDNMTANGNYGYGWPGLGPGAGGNSTVDAVAAGRKGYVCIVAPDSAGYAIYSYTGSSIDEDAVQVTLTGLAKVSGDDITASAGLLHWYDVTAVWNLANQILARFSDGAAQVNFSTNLRSLAVQLGDLVTLDTTTCKCFGFDGDTGATKFQVVGKKLDITRGKIEWKLLEATDTSPSISVADHPWQHEETTPQANPPPELGMKRDPKDPTTWVGTYDNFGFDESQITDDLLPVPAGGGLIGDFPATSMLTDSGFKYVPPVAHTFTASKDTYCYIGGSPTARGRWVFEEVANGAPKPSTPTGTVPVVMVTTDGADITARTDLRNRGLVRSKGLGKDVDLVRAQDESARDGIISGFDMAVPGGGGLAGTVPAGVARVNGERIERLTDEDHTFTASRRTFVDIDAAGDYTYVEMALAGAVEVLEASGKTRILTVITDGSDITSVERHPYVQRQMSRAISPGAIRDGQVPNGLLEDYNAALGAFPCWEEDANAGVTMTPSAEHVKCGRYGMLIEADAGCTTSYFRGDMAEGLFPISPHVLYSGSLMYSTGGYARAPSMGIGLEFFDRDYVSLGVRDFVANGRAPTADATDEGALEEGTLIGVGAGETQAPATARFARVVLTIDENVAGDAGIYVSGFRLDAGASGGGGGTSTHPYVLTVGTGQQFPTPDDASAWADANLTLSATQRVLILIYPGSYEIDNGSSTVQVHEFHDWEGLGDTPEAVRLVARVHNIAMLSDVSGETGGWSIRNCHLAHDTGATTAVLDLDNTGGSGTGVLEDVIVEGGDTGIKLDDATLTIEGRVRVISSADTDELVDLGADAVLQGQRLDLQDDDTADGIITAEGFSLDLEYLDARGTGGADGINHVTPDLFRIHGGIITGWTDAIEFAGGGEVCELWDMYITGDTWALHDSATKEQTVTLHGCHIPNDEIDWTPGNLKVLGHRFDGNDYNSKFSAGQSGGIVLTNAAWTVLTWNTTILESAWSSGGSGIIQLDRRADGKLRYHVSCVSGASGGSTTFYARIEKNTGGGWTEISDSRSYATTPGSSDYVNLSQEVVVQDEAYQTQYRVSVYCNGSGNGGSVAEATTFSGETTS